MPFSQVLSHVPEGTPQDLDLETTAGECEESSSAELCQPDLGSSRQGTDEDSSDTADTPRPDLERQHSKRAVSSAQSRHARVDSTSSLYDRSQRTAAELLKPNRTSPSQLRSTVLDQGTSETSWFLGGSNFSSSNGNNLLSAVPESFTRRRSASASKTVSPLAGGLRQRPVSLRPEYRDTLSLLDTNTAAITTEVVRRSTLQSGRWSVPPHRTTHQSPTSRSSSSSSSVALSDTFSESHGDRMTDGSASPDPLINDYPNARDPSPESEGRPQESKEEKKARAGELYGTPEMPRGNANLPHIPPSALQSRVSGTNQGLPSHLPRAEKLPMSGYELLSAKLSASPGAHPALPPMYRRFEALNHRILLHLQDEIAELEEQLRRLDTADTQTRRVKHAILPASRRKENQLGIELHLHRTDILGRIGFKLEQYNRCLGAFKAAQELPSPLDSDIHDYSSYLATNHPIADLESRFLDNPDDLVSVSRQKLRAEHTHEETRFHGSPAASLSQLSGVPSLLTPHNSIGTNSKGVIDVDTVREPPGYLSPPRVGALMAFAVLLPLLAFAVVPGFAGRLFVMVMAALGIVGPLVQATTGMGKSQAGTMSATDAFVGASIYGSVVVAMAMIVP